MQHEIYIVIGDTLAFNLASPNGSRLDLDTEKLHRVISEFENERERFKSEIERADELEKIANRFREKARGRMMNLADEILECFSPELTKNQKSDKQKMHEKIISALVKSFS